MFNLFQILIEKIGIYLDVNNFIKIQTNMIIFYLLSQGFFFIWLILTRSCPEG